MKLHILGCAGWIPKENETSCFMLEDKDELVLLDAGTGVSRLDRYADVIRKYDKISVVLTHYHLDHTIGLIYLLPYIADKELYIYGPGRPIYEKTTYECMKELLQPAFFSRDIDRFARVVHCCDYMGKDFAIGNIKIGVKQQEHTAPSFRLTINNNIIYATDTVFKPEEWSDLADAKLLLHECWEVEKNPAIKHTSLEGLLTGLPLDKIKTVLLIHHNPNWSLEDISKIQNMINGTNVFLAHDNEVYDL